MVLRTLAAGAAGLGLLGAAMGCGDGAGDGGTSGTGRVSFASWGEKYIEVGIPAADFADGWSARYGRFLVLVGGVRVADAEGNVGAEDTTFHLVDHVAPGVKPLVTFEGLEAKAWTQVSYQTSPVGDPARVVVGAGATEADRDFMVQNGCHAYVEGTLSDGTVDKTFAWCLGVPTPTPTATARSRSRSWPRSISMIFLATPTAPARRAAWRISAITSSFSRAPSATSAARGSASSRTRDQLRQPTTFPGASILPPAGFGTTLPAG